VALTSPQVSSYLSKFQGLALRPSLTKATLQSQRNPRKTKTFQINPKLPGKLPTKEKIEKLHRISNWTQGFPNSIVHFLSKKNPIKKAKPVKSL
jgi:hypothetical protein